MVVKTERERERQTETETEIRLAVDLAVGSGNRSHVLAYFSRGSGKIWRVAPPLVGTMLEVPKRGNRVPSVPCAVVVTVRCRLDSAVPIAARLQ